MKMKILMVIFLLVMFSFMIANVYADGASKCPRCNNFLQRGNICKLHGQQTPLIPLPDPGTKIVPGGFELTATAAEHYCRFCATGPFKSQADLQNNHLIKQGNNYVCMYTVIATPVGGGRHEYIKIIPLHECPICSNPIHEGFKYCTTCGYGLD